MDYKETLDYIYNLKRFSDYKPGLERIEYILRKLGNPQKKYKVIHVGGTNGKGSTVSIISSIIQCSGFKVGTFTSPHLTNFTERIKVDNKEITEKEIVKFFSEIKPIIEETKILGNRMHPTFFEITTAIALKYFAKKKVDFAVLEVGLGGRLDSTNIVKPLVSVITNIGLEHTDVLGNTKEKIAWEKSGIIKNRRPVITAVTDDKVFSIFESVCKKKKAIIWRVGKNITFYKSKSTLKGQTFDVKVGKKRLNKLYTHLLGDYQLVNATTAIGAIYLLKLSGIKIKEASIRSGLKKVKWPGRFEAIRKKPLIILDSAKDHLAMNKLKESIIGLKYQRLILILSISKDKKINLILPEIIPFSDIVIITKHNTMGRAEDPQNLKNRIKKYKKNTVIKNSIKQAIDHALKIANPKDLICITGSVFTVGEARDILIGKKQSVLGRNLNESRKR